MKKQTLIFFALLIASMTMHAENYVNVPAVDLGKEYPTDRLSLNQVAEVTFIPLETTDNSLIKEYSHITINSDKIVVSDHSQGQIFIFDRNGKFINKVARKGLGPEEYQAISLSCVDFDANRIYIWDYNTLGRVKIYDFSGKYIKQLNIGRLPWPDQMYVFDRSHLIIHCDQNNLSNTKPGAQPYFLINTETGKASPLNLRIDKPLSNQYGQRDGSGAVKSLQLIPIYPMIKSGGNVITSDFSLTPVYQEENGKLMPILKRNGTGDLGNGRARLSSVQNISDRFIILRTTDTALNKNSGKFDVSDPQILCYDRKNKSLKTVDVFSEDLNHDVAIDSWNMDLPANTSAAIIPTMALEKWHESGKLSEKAEAIYSTMDEDSNWLLMVIEFK